MKHLLKACKRYWMQILLLMLLCMTGIAAVTYAWLVYRRSLVTATRVSTPIELEIRAGNKEDASMIDLGDIDVTGEAKKKDYIFCVTSDKECHYALQLAYTTNIPFTYTIYKATETNNVSDDAENVAVYTSKNADGSEDNYYYQFSDILNGAYLNMDETTGIAKQSDAYKESLTYGIYTNIQKNAVPLYWQSNNNASESDTNSEYSYMLLNDENSFLQYYVLEVSWAGENITNDGETDIIYITTKRID